MLGMVIMASGGMAIMTAGLLSMMNIDSKFRSDNMGKDPIIGISFIIFVGPILHWVSGVASSNCEKVSLGVSLGLIV